MTFDKEGMKNGLILPAVVLFSLLPHFLIYMNFRIYTDMALLTIEARRMLDGGAMGETFYEVNPPLSILYYTIPVLASRFFGIPEYLSPYLWSAALIFLSVLAVNFLLRRAGLVEKGSALYFTCCFLAIAVIVPDYYFGERDHMIAVALAPFVLLQIAKTKRIALSRWFEYALLLCGSVIILIKPHYGLVPACFLLHRMIVQKRLSVIFDSDFVIPGMTALLYVVSVFVFFPDYIHRILPDGIALYLSMRDDLIGQKFLIGLTVTSCMAMISALLLQGRERAAALLSSLVCFLTLIPFYVQGKGFTYQLLPFMIFTGLTLAIVLYALIRVAMARMTGRTELAPIVSYGILVLTLLATFGMNPRYNTHSEYKNAPLAKIMEECGKGCSFYMISTMGEIILPLSIYTQTGFGSRFGYAWFLLPILKGERRMQQEPDNKALEAWTGKYKERYTRYVGEDFKRYRPDMVFIGDCEYFTGKEENCLKPFLDFYTTDAEFREEWSHYKPAGTINLKWDDYFRNLPGPTPGRKDYAVTIFRRDKK